MKSIGLYWFDQDLRVNDNPNLQKAAREVDELICLYCIDPKLLAPNRYSLLPMSMQRWRFLKESLHDLDNVCNSTGNIWWWSMTRRSTPYQHWSNIMA